MNTRNKFTGLTADQIFRMHMRTVRLETALLVVWTLLLALAAWQRIGRRAISSDAYWMILMVYLIGWLALSTAIGWNFTSLNLVLNQNCDAVAFAEVCARLRRRFHPRPYADVLAVNEAMGLLWSGRRDEALALVDSLQLHKNSVPAQLSVWNIRFNVFSVRGDVETLKNIRLWTQQYASTLTRAAHQKQAAQLLAIMDCGIAFALGDYPAFRRMEESLGTTYVANIQKASSAFRLARADLAEGEVRNARARLEFVVSVGGTLYIVNEARALLQTITV